MDGNLCELFRVARRQTIKFLIMLSSSRVKRGKAVCRITSLSERGKLEIYLLIKFEFCLHEKVVNFCGVEFITARSLDERFTDSFCTEACLYLPACHAHNVFMLKSKAPARTRLAAFCQRRLPLIHIVVCSNLFNFMEGGGTEGRRAVFRQNHIRIWQIRCLLTCVWRKKFPNRQAHHSHSTYCSIDFLCLYPNTICKQRAEIKKQFASVNSFYFLFRSMIWNSVSLLSGSHS